MNAERLKEIKEMLAKPAPYLGHATCCELVAEVERLQGIVRWREEPVDKRLHGDLMRAATKSSHELIAVTVERDGLKRGVGHLAAERDSLAAKLAVAREALGDIRAYTCANRFEHADTCIEAGYTPCEVCIATEALARIDGDGTEGRGG